MERIDKIFEQVREYDFFVPFHSMPSKVFVEVGQRVSPGQILYKRESLGVAKIINLAKELDCKPEKCKDYLCRIDGEFILPDEILAEKVEFNGLAIKKVVAGVEGIINFDSLDKGVLKIMSEREEMNESVVIGGIVQKIDMLKGITFTVTARKINYFVGKFKYSLDHVDKAHGYQNNLNYFKVIKQGDSVYTINDLEANYKDCVVFAGRFLYPNLFQEIVNRGATAVIAYSMDYDDFLKIEDSGKVLLLGGFGHLNLNSLILSHIREFESKYLFVDQRNGGEIFFFAEEEGVLNISDKDDNEDISVVKSLVGSNSHKDSIIDSEIGVEKNVVEENKKILLRSFDVEDFGLVGEFSGFVSDKDYVLVDFDGREKKMINRRSVEIVE